MRVIDADTYVLRVDLGFKVAATLTIRVRNLWLPELNTPEGVTARAMIVALFEARPAIVIESYKDQQTFARWVADVYLNGVLITDILREHGFAKGTA